MGQVGWSQTGQKAIMLSRYARYQMIKKVAYSTRPLLIHAINNSIIIDSQPIIYWHAYHSSRGQSTTGLGFVASMAKSILGSFPVPLTRRKPRGGQPRRIRSVFFSYPHGSNSRAPDRTMRARWKQALAWDYTKLPTLLETIKEDQVSQLSRNPGDGQPDQRICLSPDGTHNRGTPLARQQRSSQ